ncbi:MAG TPA: TRAP transporter substrate-binding protein [Stellaceae bacterium]|nr:TRAP transporter substrate-binding protein [Stellaceae bacterium]
MALVAVAGTTAAAEAQVVMKFAHGDQPGAPTALSSASEWFKQQVESKTEGRVKVQIYPSNQLGDEMVAMNGLKLGAVDATYIVFAPITSAVPEVDIFSLPFLFKGVDQALRAANGPIGEYLKPKIEAAIAAKVACWASQGERDMWDSKRPIHAMADLKGLKMRVMQSPVQVDAYTALGAAPTPMPFGEVFTALQTGVIDGADAGPADVENEKFYQVTKYLTLTQHNFLVNPMLISDGFLAKLSPQDQQLVLTLAVQSCDIVTSVSKKENAEYLEKLKTQGIQVFDFSDADRKAFIAAMQPVYDKAAPKVGGMDLIKKAMDTP